MGGRLLIVDIEDDSYDGMLLGISIVQVSVRDFDYEFIVEDNEVCYKGVLELISQTTNGMFFLYMLYIVLADLLKRWRVFHILKLKGMHFCCILMP